jgi:hypothetical protein
MSSHRDVLVRVAPEILALLKGGEPSPVVILRVVELDDGTYEMVLGQPLRDAIEEQRAQDKASAESDEFVRRYG